MPPEPKRRRVTQACKACRDSKLRCDLGDSAAPKDPPCERCLRTGRTCDFVGSHLRCKPRKMTRRGSAAGPSIGVAALQDVASAQTSPTAPVPLRVPFAAPQEFLETPADALRILVAAVEEQDQRASSPSPSTPPRRDSPTRVWSRWGPVRDGLLTTDEANVLLAFYNDHLAPVYPVVPLRLFEPEHFPLLLQEPILLAAICLVASRFHDLGPSFDVSEPSRARVVHGKLVAWVITRLGYLTMGDPTFTTIGTVEGLLVLSEWPPRAPVLRDPASTSSSTRSPPSATKQFDDLSWKLTGLAVRIAQELSLHDETTYKDSVPPWAGRRRLDAWLYCLSADRHVSVRLGRVSLIQAKMSTAWWEGVNGLMYPAAPQSTDNVFMTDTSWKETQGISEITHLIGFLQELLYYSPNLTTDLIRTRRFEPILHRLKPELDSLSQLLTGMADYDVLDESQPGMEAEELREIRMRIEVDYVRLYANAIGMRAAHARLSHRFNHPERNPLFATSILRWAEGPFILEAVTAAISLLRCGVALHRRHVLRYCPGRTFLRMMFASVFLMKAMSFGAMLQEVVDVVELQWSLIAAFRSAAVDDDHLVAQLASLLSRLLAQTRPTDRDEGAAAQDDDAPPPLDPLAFLDFDLTTIGGLDMSAAFGDTGSGGGDAFHNIIGCNPNGLVSVIEGVLAGGLFSSGS
ncbi:hypothetical protein Q8F55_003237 [Vanrija albida]|uniref:Zn(2)-C6 fungal-type domain-containing protein n=1 Tax=Vanrija albida TaxID=181172 RepID=A0ABR3QBW3_9TREE